jgi:hypothetical protein
LQLPAQGTIASDSFSGGLKPAYVYLRPFVFSYCKGAAETPQRRAPFADVQWFKPVRDCGIAAPRRRESTNLSRERTENTAIVFGLPLSSSVKSFLRQAATAPFPFTDDHIHLHQTGSRTEPRMTLGRREPRKAVPRRSRSSARFRAPFPGSFETRAKPWRRQFRLCCLSFCLISGQNSGSRFPSAAAEKLVTSRDSSSPPPTLGRG